MQCTTLRLHEVMLYSSNVVTSKSQRVLGEADRDTTEITKGRGDQNAADLCHFHLPLPELAQLQSSLYSRVCACLSEKSREREREGVDVIQ